MIPRFFRPGIGATLLGARVLFAVVLSPVALAQEAHQPASTAQTADESAFLAENDAAMTKMMNDMAAKPSASFMASISWRCSTMISCAIRRRRSFLP